MSVCYRRMGFIGDIHGEDVFLERALDFLESREVELVASTGDVADGAGSVDRCCALLRARKVLTVRGNHDRWFAKRTLRELPLATAPTQVNSEADDLLASLPETVELDTVAGRALLCHGVGRNDMARLTPDDYGYAIESNEDLQRIVRARSYRFMLAGHTHRRMVRHFGEVTVINAGTLARDFEPCFMELDFEAALVRVFLFRPDGQIQPAAPEVIPLQSD
jgi:predicted phosphodiesterase